MQRSFDDRRIIKLYWMDATLLEQEQLFMDVVPLLQEGSAIMTKASMFFYHF